MKQIADYVWPVENYTDKIHTCLKTMFTLQKHLSFTKDQMRSHLIRSYIWLASNNATQQQLMDKLISTGIKKLIQAGIVKKVTSKLSVTDQWQYAEYVTQCGYTDITSSMAVAKTDAARKAALRRSLGGSTLHRLNNLEVSS